MSAEQKADVGVSHAERRGSTSEVRNVQNVALADATAKAGVTPWSKAMFRVSRCSQALLTAYTDAK